MNILVSHTEATDRLQSYKLILKDHMSLVYFLIGHPFETLEIVHYLLCFFSRMLIAFTLEMIQPVDLALGFAPKTPAPPRAPLEEMMFPTAVNYITVICSVEAPINLHTN